MQQLQPRALFHNCFHIGEEDKTGILYTLHGKKQHMLTFPLSFYSTLSLPVLPVKPGFFFPFISALVELEPSRSIISSLSSSYTAFLFSRVSYLFVHCFSFERYKKKKDSKKVCSS
ncbi:Minor capsid protein L2 [Folsomia candida]|uniref:Minor capsid protein L2 n=1 Tax=Folsomia candida TaxID=158441 RepID=A0A226DGS0_FOLCA|nr:Minor capsid protein L2 [Folsomia candida]